MLQNDAIVSIREEESKMGFLDSFHGCIHDAQHGETGRLGLITVGMLRCLRNSFGYGLVAKRNEHNICGRFFRVNAIKNTRGEWREYGSGNWVPLHHFPDFDPTNGHDGDTLIWDAFVNRIFVADDKEMYMSMCFKEFEKSTVITFDLNINENSSLKNAITVLDTMWVMNVLILETAGIAHANVILAFQATNV